MSVISSSQIRDRIFSREAKPESIEGGRRGSVLKWTEGASVNLG